MVFEELCTEVKRVLTVELRVFVDNRHLMTGDGVLRDGPMLQGGQGRGCEGDRAEGRGPDRQASQQGEAKERV